MSNDSPSHAAGSGSKIFFMTNLTVTYVALMFTTIHCKIKHILIVVICYSLGGKYSSVALQQAASAKVHYQVDSIHTCSKALIFALFTQRSVRIFS